MESTGRRLSSKRRYLRNLVEIVDEIGLQETCRIAADMETLPATHHCWGSVDVEMSPGTTCRGGVVLALRREIGNRAHVVHRRARAISVSLLMPSGDKCHYTVVHVDPRARLAQRKDLVTRIARWVKREASHVVMGRLELRCHGLYLRCGRRCRRACGRTIRSASSTRSQSCTRARRP